MIAASMLLAAPIAWMSPVKCRLRSSIGTTCACPPPAAPPLSPKTGPSDASRMHSIGSLPMWPSPWVSPTEVVDLPSPNRVGVMPATQISFPSGRSARRSRTSSDTFPLCLPYGSTSSSSKPAASAIPAIGCNRASCAI